VTKVVSAAGPTEDKTAPAERCRVRSNRRPTEAGGHLSQQDESDEDEVGRDIAPVEDIGVPQQHQRRAGRGAESGERNDVAPGKEALQAIEPEEREEDDANVVGRITDRRVEKKVDVSGQDGENHGQHPSMKPFDTHSERRLSDDRATLGRTDGKRWLSSCPNIAQRPLSIATVTEGALFGQEKKKPWLRGKD
jgi:hypothetical protein